ncbi:restriction endonuclease subunit S [Amylibacter sp.]|nr:restriction endonuclease subunit S [Amylibacter sp.]
MSERVPEGWRISKLEDHLYRPLAYGVLKPDSFVDDGVPMLRIQDVSISGLNRRKLHRISEKLHQEFKRTQLKEGDLVISLVGTIGRVLEIPKSLDGANVSRAFGVIGLSDDINRDYIKQFLTSQKTQDWIQEQAQGNAQKVLNLGGLRNLSIVSPPLPEQKKIASILTSVDEVIETTQKQIDKLQDLKKATMNELLTKGIGHTEFKDSELGRIPMSWETKRLDEVSIISRGKFSHRPRNDPNFYNGNYPYLQTGDIPTDVTDITLFTQTLNDKGLKVSKLFPKDTLVLTIAATIGEVGVLTFDSCFPDSLVGINCIKNKMSPYFLLYTLRSAKQNLIAEAPESAQKNLNLDILNPFSIKMPSLTEQRKIETILLSIDDNLKEKTQKLIQIQSLKKSLMQDLLTGKVRVQVH